MSGIVSDISKKVKQVDRKQLFLLFLMFVLAFGVRGHLLKYDYMFGFDSYYHARMAGELLQTGVVPEVDPSAYYFIEGGVAPPKNQFFWQFTTGIYRIATLGSPYDKDTWIFFVQVLPALFGALTVVAMFFLGKEIYGKPAGDVMALVAAVIPSYVYRTLAGFFEEDCLGFLWLVIGLVFLVKAIKDPVFNKKGIINAVLSGIFFGLMAITWDMFLLIPLVLGLYTFFGLIGVYTKDGFKKLIEFAKLYAISIVIFIVIATANYGIGWTGSAWAYANQSISKAAGAFGLPEAMAIPLAAIVGVLFLAFVVYLAYSNRSPEKKKSGMKTINIIAMLLLYLAVISLALTFVTTPKLFEETSVLGMTVGEENTGHQFFGIKYNALIIFPWLAMLLIPIIFYREKKGHLSIILFFWILITFFMAWYKLKFTYTLGLPIAAAAGVIAAEMFYYLKGRTELEQKIIALCLGFMLLVGIASATIFVPDKIPHISNPYPDWQGTLEWIQDPANISEDAKFFNWWDEGHWISFIGERAVSADNRNMSFEGNRDFSLFNITSDLSEALTIAKEYDFDYVILDSDSFLKIGSYGNYGYNTMNSGDPRIAKFLMAPHAAMLCTESNGVYICGSNSIPKAQMESVPAKWTTVSNQLYENTVPLYIYRAEDNSELYITNPAVNESMLARLWFHEDEAMKYFDEVYNAKGMRIFKVNKEALYANNNSMPLE